MPDYTTLNLESALKAIGDYVGVELPMSVAMEDTIGGYRFDDTPDDGTLRWPTGAIWQVEGQVIYSLARALPIQIALDLGTGLGCATSHLARGLKDSGRKGKVVTVDTMPDGGGLIMGDLATYIQFAGGITSLDSLRQLPDESYDLILEDTPLSKTPDLAPPVYAEIQRVLRPGGVLVVHDAAHPGVGNSVREGLRRAGISPFSVRIPPADCGLAIWKKAGVLSHESDQETAEAEQAPATRTARKRSGARKRRTQTGA